MSFRRFLIAFSRATVAAEAAARSVGSGASRGRRGFLPVPPRRPRGLVLGAAGPLAPLRAGEGRADVLRGQPRPAPRAGGGPAWQSPAAGVHFLGGAVRRGGGPGGSGSAMDPRGKALAAEESSLVSARRRVCVRSWVGEARPAGAGAPARPACLFLSPEGASKPGWEALAHGAGETSCCEDRAPAGARARGLRRSWEGGSTAESGPVAPHLETQLRSCARGRGAGGEMRTPGTLWARVQQARALP